MDTLDKAYWENKIVICENIGEVPSVIEFWAEANSVSLDKDILAHLKSHFSQHIRTRLCLEPNGFATLHTTTAYDHTAKELLIHKDFPFEEEFIDDKVCNCPKENFRFNGIGCQCGGY